MSGIISRLSFHLNRFSRIWTIDYYTFQYKGILQELQELFSIFWRNLGK